MNAYFINLCRLEVKSKVLSLLINSMSHKTWSWTVETSVKLKPKMSMKYLLIELSAFSQLPKRCIFECRFLVSVSDPHWKLFSSDRDKYPKSSLLRGCCGYSCIWIYPKDTLWLCSGCHGNVAWWFWDFCFYEVIMILQLGIWSGERICYG